MQWLISQIQRHTILSPKQINHCFERTIAASDITLHDIEIGATHGKFKVKSKTERNTYLLWREQAPMQMQLP